MDDVPTGFGWVRAKCPFHDDRTASASVNHELQGFACMACGVTGDAIKLLQDQLGLTFREALEKARYLSGDETPTRGSGGKPPKRRRSSDLFD